MTKRDLNQNTKYNENFIDTFESISLLAINQ